MKKNLNAQLRGWLKHWYLASGGEYARGLLDPGAKGEEKIAYKTLVEFINQGVSRDASPLIP